jgi:acetoin utilization deacetylase AcuC-like enzyme
MPVVWSDRCLLHEPAREMWIGLPMPATESPARIERIRDALDGATLVESEPHDDEILGRVHEEGLLRYLESAWEQWQSTGIPAEPGQDRVVPYVFAHPALGSTLMEPTAVWARPGFYAYDTMTLIGPGTWEAARTAVDAALTAADLVRGGVDAAYACARPPGHHACRAAFGGSCYLNSAACAAVALGLGRGIVAVIDIDAHHCNGTEEIFAGSADVLVGSVHVDPRAGWFPHFLGWADRLNVKNIPLAPGSGDAEWLEAVSALVEWARSMGAQGLVVSLGVDAAAGDPESPLEVTESGYRRAGELLGEAGLPTVIVQEGGYNLDSIGELVRETLLGFEAA